MAESLPPLNARVLALYVQARIDAMLARLVPRYWAAEVTHLELYGMIGAVAELKALVADAERNQRKDSEEITVVSGPEYGRRTRG